MKCQLRLVFLLISLGYVGCSPDLMTQELTDSGPNNLLTTLFDTSRSSSTSISEDIRVLIEDALEFNERFPQISDQTRIEDLKLIKKLAQKPDCHVEALEDRLEESRRFAQFPKLTRYLDSINKETVDFCLHRLELELQTHITTSISNQIDWSVVWKLTYFVQDQRENNEPGVGIFLNIPFRELALGLMEFSKELDNKDWVRPNGISVGEHLDSFFYYVQDRFMETGQFMSDTFRKSLQEYRALNQLLADNKKSHILDVSQETTLNLLEAANICIELHGVEDKRDLLLETRYNFYQVSDTVFRAYGVGAPLSVEETKDYIEQLEYLCDFRQRVYHEDHIDLKAQATIFLHLTFIEEQPNCQPEYLLVMRDILNEYGNYVNLGPYLISLARDQLKVCKIYVLREATHVHSAMIEWDWTQIEALFEYYIFLEPPLESDQLYHNFPLDWPRFMRALRAYLASRPAPIVIPPTINALEGSRLMLRASRFIGAPCMRLVRPLSQINETFDEIQKVEAQMNRLASTSDHQITDLEREVLFPMMNKTKLCLMLLQYPIEGTV